jgi:hypothetical protein
MLPTSRTSSEEFNPRSHFALLASYNQKTDFLTVDRQSLSFIHEMIHFGDHAGTPYGYFLDSIYEIHIHAFRQLLGCFNHPGGPELPVPLARLFDDVAQIKRSIRASAAPGYDVEQCLDLIAVLSALWPKIVVVERAFEGLSQSGSFSLDFDSVLDGLNLVEALGDASQNAFPPNVFELLKISFDDKTWNIPDRPIPTIRDRDHPAQEFGAAALLETRAFFLERGASETDPLPAIVSRDAVAYYGPMGALAEICISIGVRDIHKITDTYMALSDLSLYAPVGGIYRTLRKANVWSEVHPGYRFIELMNIIKDIGPFNRAEKLDLFDYQERYCERLGWAGPREFLKIGSEIEPANYRARRHRAACRLKLSHPRYFVNANLTYLELPNDDEHEKWLNDYLPFVIDTGDCERSFVGQMETDVYLERLTGAYIQSLGWSLLMLGDTDCRENLNPHFPYSRYLRWPGSASLSAFFDSVTRQHIRLARI